LLGAFYFFNYYPNPAKPLLQQGLFISSSTLNQLQTASDTWHHQDPSSPNLSHFSRQNKSQLYPPTAKPGTCFPIPTDTFISPTQLPNTSLSVAITDAIGTPKPHCYLVPSFWDLIEATIKSKE
jgi:hypothetical protein